MFRNRYLLPLGVLLLVMLPMLGDAPAVAGVQWTYLRLDPAGGRIGLAVGAAVGIETGPGAIVSAAVGGIIFSTAGYLDATWLTDYVQD